MFLKHFLVITLLFVPQVLQEAPRCRGCRVRYYKYPNWPIQYIRQMDRFHAPLELMEAPVSAKRKLPGNLNIVRVINQYRKISTAEVQKVQQRSKIVVQRQPNDYSFIVKLQLKGVGLCSGALVKNQLVLTTSSCLKSLSPQQLSQLQVLSKGAQLHRVTSVQHLDSKTELTLLRLTKQPDNLQPIALCERALTKGANVSMLMASEDLSYFGRRRSQLLSNKACKLSYIQDDNVFITPNMLCVRNSQQPDRCATIKGDALLFDNKLCGLNIYGSSCRPHTINADLYSNLYKVRSSLSKIITTSSK